MTHSILDLFAGVGVGMAAKRLAAVDNGVENWAPANQVRLANDLATVYADAWDVEKADALSFDTMWASPPCQGLSRAGQQEGLPDIPTIAAAATAGVWRDLDGLRKFSLDLADERSAMLLLPLVYAERYQPEFVVLEQVPAVHDAWVAIARELAEMGYLVSIIHAEMERYGLPQTRARSLVLARRGVLHPGAPEPTHSHYNKRVPSRIAKGYKPWVSMAEASEERRFFELISPYSMSGSRARPMYRSCDEPAYTVTSHVLRGRIAYGPGKPGHSRLRTVGVDDATRKAIMRGEQPESAYTKIRRVTVKDALLWQGFPADTQIPVSDTPAATIIGNAMPPSVAEIFLKHIWSE